VHFHILLLSCQCARGWGWKKCTAGMGGDGDEMPQGWVATVMKLCGSGGMELKTTGTGVISVPVHISSEDRPQDREDYISGTSSQWWQTQRTFFTDQLAPHLDALKLDSLVEVKCSVSAF